MTFIYEQKLIICIIGLVFLCFLFSIALYTLYVSKNQKEVILSLYIIFFVFGFFIFLVNMTRKTVIQISSDEYKYEKLIKKELAAQKKIKDFLEEHPEFKELSK